jgi:hypothetical protein
MANGKYDQYDQYDQEFENMRRDRFYLDSEREDSCDRRLLAESFGDDEAEDDYPYYDEPEPYYGDDDDDEDGFEREIGDEQPSPTPVLVKCPDCCDNPECCPGHVEGQHPLPFLHLVKPATEKLATIKQAAKKYVDEQFEVLKEHGSLKRISKSAYESTVNEVVRATAPSKATGARSSRMKPKPKSKPKSAGGKKSKPMPERVGPRKRQINPPKKDSTGCSGKKVNKKH